MLWVSFHQKSIQLTKKSDSEGTDLPLLHMNMHLNQTDTGLFWTKELTKIGNSYRKIASLALWILHINETTSNQTTYHVDDAYESNAHIFF